MATFEDLKILPQLRACNYMRCWDDAEEWATTGENHLADAGSQDQFLVKHASHKIAEIRGVVFSTTKGTSGVFRLQNSPQHPASQRGGWMRRLLRALGVA